MVTSLYGSIVELAPNSRSMSLNLSWRLMARRKSEKSTKLPYLSATHTRHTATIDTSRGYGMLRYTTESCLMSLPCSVCDFLLLSSTTMSPGGPSQKSLHHPPRNGNATLKGPIIAEDPRNFRSMICPIYLPSRNDEQLGLLYSNVTQLSPLSSNLCPPPALRPWIFKQICTHSMP